MLLALVGGAAMIGCWLILSVNGDPRIDPRGVFLGIFGATLGAFGAVWLLG
jgi:hypothetical protein